MRHIEKALNKLVSDNPHAPFDYQKFITIDNATHEDGSELFGVAPIVSFAIQSNPIHEVGGINGVQAVDMLEYVKCLFQSLDNAFPHEANKQTILKIQEAILWQHERTRDRINRGVEGHNIQ